MKSISVAADHPMAGVFLQSSPLENLCAEGAEALARARAKKKRRMVEEEYGG